MLLSGCGRINYPALPDEAIAFEMGTFEDIEQDDNTFGTIEYKGRTYIGYGTVNNSYKLKSIGDCLGYIIQDEIYKAVAIMSRHCFREDSPEFGRRGVMKKKFLFVGYQEVLCSS